MSTSTKKDQFLIPRDRRSRHQFSIANGILEDYYRILGQTGFALLSLLTYSANSKQDETTYISFSYIGEFMGISSRTITNYLALLEICGLVHRQRPDEVEGVELPSQKTYKGNLSNTYYVLDAPSLDTEKVAELAGLLAMSPLPTTFKETVTKRMRSWFSLSDFQKSRKRHYIVTRSAPPLQPPLLSDADADLMTGEAATSPPSVMFFSTESILRKVNILTPKLIERYKILSPIYILSVIFTGYQTFGERLVDDSFGGWVVSQLRAKLAPPPYMNSLSKKWIENFASDEDVSLRELILGHSGHYLHGGQLRMIGLNEDEIKAVMQIKDRLRLWNPEDEEE